MLQRYIKKSIELGLNSYLGPDSRTLFGELFTGIYDLSETEVDGITEYFNRLRPAVNFGFPRNAIGPEPSVFIFNGSASQPGFCTGDYGGWGGQPSTPATYGITPGSSLVPNSAAAAAGPGGAAFILSSLWTHQYQIMILARGGPEPVMWTCEVIKSILLAAKNYFLSKAMQSVVLQTSEIQFRDDLAPSDLFACSITLQCGREFSQADTSQSLQDAFKLPGLIAPSGSDSHPVGRPPSRIQVDP